MKQILPKFLLVSLVMLSFQAFADSSDKEITKSTHSRNQFKIPAACILKAQAIATVTAMSSNDRASSLSFVSVLSAAGSSIVVEYNLTPKLIQKGSNQNDSRDSPRGSGNTNSNSAMTEISLTGTLGTLQISLADVNGTAISTTSVYASTSDAQAQSSGASLAASLIQVANNQTTIDLDLLGSNIKSFYTHLTFHSDLVNQATASGISIAGVSTTPTTGLPYAQAHAMTLADIVTSIDIKTVVRFDGSNLTLDTPITQLDC